MRYNIAVVAGVAEAFQPLRGGKRCEGIIDVVDHQRVDLSLLQRKESGGLILYELED